MKSVRVWDLPTRLFHWLLVVAVVGLVITGNVGGDAMVWHFRLGYMALTLLLFRICWGFIGGHWSRFSSFVRMPWNVLAYLRGKQSAPPAGHNPLGAYSVLGLLFVALAQISAGLMSDDEIMAAGPLTAKVPSEWVGFASFMHTEVIKVVLVVLVLLHVAAILWYRFKKDDNLIKPMITGDKVLGLDVAPSRDDAVSRLVALGVLVLCAGAVGLLLRWAQS